MHQDLKGSNDGSYFAKYEVPCHWSLAPQQSTQVSSLTAQYTEKYCSMQLLWRNKRLILQETNNRYYMKYVRFWSGSGVSCRDILDGVVCVGSCSSSSKLVLLFPNPSEGSPFREIQVRTWSLSDSLKNIITGKLFWKKSPNSHPKYSPLWLFCGCWSPQAWDTRLFQMWSL